MPMQKKQDKRPAFSDAALHGAGDGHCGGAGGDGIGAIRLLGIGGRRDGDLPGNGGKGAGGSIVGVVVSFLPRIAVIRHRQAGEGRVEGIRQDHVVPCRGGGIAEVLEDEGIGQLSALRDGGGADGLADGEVRPLGRRQCGLRRQGRCQTAAGDGGRVGDGGLLIQRRIAGNSGLVHQQRIASGGDGETGDGQGRPCRHCGGRLQDTVDIYPQRPLVVGQRVHGVRAEGVATQIVRQCQFRQGRCAAVHQRQHVGDVVSGGVAAAGRRLGEGQRLQQLTGDGVGIGGAAVIDQGGEVGKACHDIHSCSIVGGAAAPIQHMPQHQSG